MADDPRLKIPDELTRPVDVSKIRPARPPSALAGLGELGKPLSIGLDFLFTAAAGGVLGWLLDRWLGWTPYGVVAGLTVGFIAGTWRLLKRLNKDSSPPPSRPR